MSKPGRMSLLISYHFIMPIVIGNTNMTKPIFILFILPEVVYVIFNPPIVQYPFPILTNVMWELSWLNRRLTICPNHAADAWKPVGIVSIRVRVDGMPVHWPVTLPVICIWLLVVWDTVIWLEKQQHELIALHPLSIWNVPIQFGVEENGPIQLYAEEFVPFMKWKQKSRVLNGGKKYRFTCY